MTQNQTPVFVVLIASILFSVGLLYVLITNYSDQKVNLVCGDMLLSGQTMSNLRVDVNNVEYGFFRILVDDKSNARANKTLAINDYKTLFDKIKKQPKKTLLAADVVNEDAGDAITLTICINKPRATKQHELTYQIITFYPSQSLFRVSKNAPNIALIRDKQWVYFDLSDNEYNALNGLIGSIT